MVERVMSNRRRSAQERLETACKASNKRESQCHCDFYEFPHCDFYEIPNVVIVGFRISDVVAALQPEPINRIKCKTFNSLVDTKQTLVLLEHAQKNAKKAQPENTRKIGENFHLPLEKHMQLSFEAKEKRSV